MLFIESSGFLYFSGLLILIGFYNLYLRTIFLWNNNKYASKLRVILEVSLSIIVVSFSFILKIFTENEDPQFTFFRFLFIALLIINFVLHVKTHQKLGIEYLDEEEKKKRK